VSSTPSSFPTDPSDDPTVEQRAERAGVSGALSGGASAGGASAGGAGASSHEADGQTGETGKKDGEAGGTEGLKIIGGLLALTAGLITLILMVAVALLVKPDTTGGSITTTAVGVVGSIVAAYFGVKIGTDGTKDAIKANEGAAEAHQEEAIKAQVLALHVPSEKAGEVIEHMKALGQLPNAKIEAALSKRAQTGAEGSKPTP
jgi:uncharacterized membrane protein YeaQ/YmgE (transglycosylase-associated protein family)